MSPLDQACALLADLLKDGPRNAAEILAAAEGVNISERTTQRAAEQMGVIKMKAGFAGGWTWTLPAEDAKAEKDLQGQGTAPDNVKVLPRVETANTQVSARVTVPERAVIIAARLHKLESVRGMKGPFYPQDSRIRAWAQAGISDPDLKEAYARATTDHKGMLTVGIMDGYVNDVMAEVVT